MLSLIFYAWVAMVTPRQPTSTVAPPMGANEAPKHPEKQAESRRTVIEMFKIAFSPVRNDGFATFEPSWT